MHESQQCDNNGVKKYKGSQQDTSVSQEEGAHPMQQALAQQGPSQTQLIDPDIEQIQQEEGTPSRPARPTQVTQPDSKLSS
jgi:hypothetical protein